MLVTTREVQMSASLNFAPIPPELDPRVRQVLKQMTEEAAVEGASAAFLFGSYARGVAQEESDVDLAFVGPDREWLCDRREGLLVSFGWRSAGRFHEAMASAEWGPSSVQGLRSSIIIWDPTGAADELKKAAQIWTWASIAGKCKAWVPEQITSLAEDAQRAFCQFRRGNKWVATVLKGVLSARLAKILSVHLHILYDSENQLSDLVAQELGEPWKSIQSVAFSSQDEDFGTSLRATMRLYSYAASFVYGIMNERQKRVVRGACEVIGQPLRINA
jgi:hypothetical protein